MTNDFAGDKKVGTSVLMRAENALKHWVVPRLPRWIETYHLTYMTILWTAGNVILGFYAKADLRFLWGVNVLIVLQYLTDLFDGELGRQRDTGLIKWGFYMDHFLDYVFLCSIVFVGYMISPIGMELWYIALMVVLGAFMVNSFLSFAATNEFEIYHFGMGPTEARGGIILINIYIIFAGTGHFNILLPAAVVICFIGLLINTYMIHRKLWQIDMGNKKSREDQK